MAAEEKKIVAVVQARMASKRLPSKVLLDLEGKSVLLHIIDRLLRSTLIDHIVVASTTNPEDSALEEIVHNYHPKVSCYRGSENDLIDRLYQAVRPYHPLVVARITGDSPLVDWSIVDQVILRLIDSAADYVTTGFEKKTYPVGLDLEVFSFATLEKLWKETSDAKEREFPSLFIREHPGQFNCQEVASNKDYSQYRLTLDEPADYELIKKIYQELYPKNPNFLMQDIVSLLEGNHELAKINQHVKQQWKNY